MKAEPTCVQLRPSTEIDPVRTLPVRTSRNQAGSAIVGPAVVLVLPAGLDRHWNAEAPLGKMVIRAFIEPGSIVSRTIAPAWVALPAMVRLSTRAMIVPS